MQGFSLFDQTGNQLTAVDRREGSVDAPLFFEIFIFCLAVAFGGPSMQSEFAVGIGYRETGLQHGRLRRIAIAQLLPGHQRGAELALFTGRPAGPQ